MTDDMEILGWFFHLEAITKGTNWPISPGGLADGKRAIDKAVDSKGSADDVMAAYKKFAGAVGPTVMTMMLNSDDAFPEVNYSAKPTPPASGGVVLYVDESGKSLVARTFMTWGKAPEFSVM